jgi:Asp-tRNA(Asn)/Glu-tRNA(Gln) amidotransferase A subunit family amidase
VDTLGVICRSMEDIIATDNVLADTAGLAVPAGHAGLVLSGNDLQPAALRLRIPEHLLSYCDRITRAMFDALVAEIASSGITIAPITIESWEEGERSAGILSRFQASRAIGSEMRRALSPRLAARLASGDAIHDRVASRAQDACGTLQRELVRQLEAGDVLLTPGWPFRAPHVYQTHIVVQGVRKAVEPARNIFVRAANAAAAPALCLPGGFYPGRVPFGLHLMAEAGADLRVLQAGCQISEIVLRLGGNKMNEGSN